jgi:hypothetical protein
MSGEFFPRAAIDPKTSRLILIKPTEILAGSTGVTGSGMLPDTTGVPLKKQGSISRVWASRVKRSGELFPRVAIGPRISRLLLIRSTRILAGSTGVTGSEPGMFAKVIGAPLMKRGSTPKVWGSGASGNGGLFPRVVIGPRISRAILINPIEILAGSTGATGSGMLPNTTGIPLKKRRSTPRVWRAFVKSGNRPKDIPAAPNRAYKDSGWINWNSQERKKITMNSKWRSFEEAREYARSSRFKNCKEWEVFSKSSNRPEDIPSNPKRTYKDSGWVNWIDWLGNDWRSFEEAREYARGLNLNSKREWEAFSKSGNRPNDIPVNPDRIYKNSGWIGMGDWLGTGNIHKGDWRPLEEAKEYVKGLGLKNQKEWRVFVKSGNRPKDIPAAPDQIYKGSGWTGYGDWLGNGNVTQYNWRSFKEAREYARSLNLKSKKEWRLFSKSGNGSKDIPTHPDRVYKDSGWVGYGDWLGNEKIKKGRKSQ